MIPRLTPTEKAKLIAETREGKRTYSHHGKQVLMNGFHFADAITEEAAQRIAEALEQQRLVDALRAKLQEPIFLEMRTDMLANYRTPTEIAAGCVWAGEPSPGATIPAIASARTAAKSVEITQ